MRPDTECMCYKTDKYTLYLWDKIGHKDRLIDVSWCFRILEFLGAPAGFTVTWWSIPVDRVIQPNQFPTRAEVNGGWAYRGAPAVYVFRQEEWDRVLIHECVHALDWDVQPSGALKSCLEQNLSQGSLTDAIFEAATELNAEWLWAIIHSPANDNAGQTWAKQMEWQTYQASVILARQGDKPWSEDTSVFAYYVLKAALAYEMYDFLVAWLSGKVDVEIWCPYWKNYEKIFYHKAAMRKDTIGQKISMRMTNPALESR